MKPNNHLPYLILFNNQSINVLFNMNNRVWAFIYHEDSSKIHLETFEVNNHSLLNNANKSSYITHNELDLILVPRHRIYEIVLHISFGADDDRPEIKLKKEKYFYGQDLIIDDKIYLGYYNSLYDFQDDFTNGERIKIGFEERSFALVKPQNTPEQSHTSR